MTWITEDPTYLVMMGLLFTGFFALVWFMSKKRGFLYLAIAVFAGMIGGIIVERMIVTDREFLRESVWDLTLAVAHNDVDKVLTYVSEKTPVTTRRIKSEMPKYDFRSCTIIKFNQVDSESYEEIGATAHVEFIVRVDVDASGSRFGIDGTGIRKIVLTFEKEGSKQWKVTNYSHSDPSSRSRQY